MGNVANTKKTWLKRILLAGLLSILIGVGVVWYAFTVKFADTKNEKAAFNVNAINFLKEFQQNDSAANKKYAEKIISINGKVAEIELADTTVNIKMIDTLTNAYINFAFQPQDMAAVKLLKEGDSVDIKGSCSGGAYSDIMEAEFVTFKRCVLIKK